MKCGGLILGALGLSLVLGCSGPSPTQSLAITEVPTHVRYVDPGKDVPYADQWGSRIQILVAWNQVSECAVTHVVQSTRVTVLYDCTVDLLGNVSGSPLIVEGPDKEKATVGSFTGTLGVGGLQGLASMGVEGACGVLPLSASLALVAEPAP